MIHSMTGFGREEKLINDKKIVIEIRTLNSKGLDINLRVHESFSFIGEYLRKSVKEKLIKGKVDIILDVEDTNEDLQIPFNKSKIKAYLKELRKDFKIDESQIVSNLKNEKANKVSNDVKVDRVQNVLYKKVEEKKVEVPKPVDRIVEVEKMVTTVDKQEVLKEVEVLKHVDRVEYLERNNETIKEIEKSVLVKETDTQIKEVNVDTPYQVTEYKEVKIIILKK